MSAIIGTDAYKCYFNQGSTPCSGPEANVQGGITASMAGGSWLAALCSGFITDIFGRKKAIMIGAVIWVIGSIIVSASQNIGMLIAGRVINGFSVGICSAQVPVYISEMAPPSKRGRLVGAQQWAITWGIMIMVSISRQFQNDEDESNLDLSSTSAMVAPSSKALQPSDCRGPSK
jgi:MFS family permease